MPNEKEREALRRIDNYFSQRPTDIADRRRMLDSLMAPENLELPEIGEFHENIALGGGLHVDVAVPKGAGPHPVMVFLHGGGWIGGSTRSYRRFGMEYAVQGYLTVNVDYRLAPENAFPAAFDDCTNAVEWAAENARRWNGDGTRIAVGGDSSGANLAAAVAVNFAGKQDKPKISATILIYGLFDLKEFSKVDQAGCERLAKPYLSAAFPAALDDPRVSPAIALAPGAFPPTFIIAGTKDRYLSQSLVMADALQRNQLSYELHLMEDMPHIFMLMKALPARQKGMELMFDFMRRHLRR